MKLSNNKTYSVVLMRISHEHEWHHRHAEIVGITLFSN